MDLATLAVFVAVAEEGHFGRAAARLHLVQSSVSAAIARLERDLGIRLLDRSSRGVATTEAGRALLPAARRLLHDAERLRQVAGGAAGLTGRVRFGTFSALPLLDLPRLLAGFRVEHPGVEVRLTTSPSGSSGLVADVRAGRLDVAVVALPPDLLDGLRLEPLVRLRAAVLLPADHPLADRTLLAPADLAGVPFVDGPPGFGHRILADRAFAAAGVARAVRTEVADLPTLGAYVAAGLGVAVTPTDLVVPVPDVVVVPLAAPPVWEAFLATRHERSPAVAAFTAAAAASARTPA